MLLLALLCACNLPEPADPANCTPRTSFYPDVNGDGKGEATALFIGCEAPDGWVSILDTGPFDSGDTGTPRP